MNLRDDYQPGWEEKALKMAIIRDIYQSLDSENIKQDDNGRSSIELNVDKHQMTYLLTHFDSKQDFVDCLVAYAQNKEK